MKTYFYLLVVVSVMMCVGCSIHYSPEGHKDGRGGHGGIVIEIPQKKPEVKPMPN
ncbi:MAG: hypothetical protein HWE18_03135 [Gammaproteobacteria bacterium]|nr:hypothetical protein [Gammaproteobacteria bacterium]